MATADQDPLTLKEPPREAEAQRQRLRESVRDLALYLGKMSGAKLEILTAPPRPGDGRLPILVGDLAARRFGLPQTTAPFKQGFRVVVTPTGVGLLGESDLATSYAVYEVLDRLGCRWYMPSDLGEVIPHLPTVRLAEGDVSSAPGTFYRGLWYADEAFRRRNRHGGLPLNAGHALETYVTREDRRRHPEWVATVGGKPSPVRLKWSSVALAHVIADKIIAGHARDPRPSYPLTPEEGTDFDESRDDRALDAGDIDPTSQTPSLTDRLLVIVNRVAERVTATYPDVRFGLLASGPFTRPPVREQVHPAIVPQIAPLTYGRSHPMTDDRVPGNPELRALVRGWGKAARTTSYYAYAYFPAEPSAPQPMTAKWSADVPFVLQNHCRFWQPETLPNFETHLHALYLGNRLAWDPSLKPADVVAEVNTRFYGHAAAAMRAYWDYVDGVWVRTPEFSGGGFGHLRRWTPARLGEARRLLDAALAACRTPLETRRVTLADDSLRLFEAFMAMRRDLAEGRFAGLAAAAEAWRKRVVELGEKYKDQYAFTRVPWTPDTVAGRYFSIYFQPAYDDATRVARDFEVLTPRPLRAFRYHADPERRGEALGWAGG
jgi:hypothetical protein